jgi:hypothetical protein
MNRNTQTHYTQVDFAALVDSADPMVEQAAAAIKNIATSIRYDSENKLNLALAFVQPPQYLV